MEEGEGDFQFLAHAGGEGLHPILSAVLETEVVEQVPGPFFPFREALQLRLQPEVLPRREDVIEDDRSEEHTSELQSQSNLVCRLLLEKKKKTADIRSCTMS